MRDELGNQKQSRSVDVRFGSLADIGQPIRDVRFTPESGHVQRRNRCLLCAISGHYGNAVERAEEAEANSPAVAASVSAREQLTHP